MSHLKSLKFEWKIWYKCLVCQRCYQFSDRLVEHKKNTECGPKYPTLAERTLILPSESMLHRMGGPAAFGMASQNEDPSILENRASLDTEDSNGCLGAKRRLEIAYFCVHCKAIIETYPEFIRHRRQHVNIRLKKQFICKVCNIGFHECGFLIRHMHIHAFEKCGQSNMYKGTKEFGAPKIIRKRSYSVRICRKDLQSLKSISSPKNLPYKCKICHNKFHIFSTLHFHKQLHNK